MATFTNASSETRYWFNITHPGDDTHPEGSTLILDPGEEVDGPLMDGEPLPDDFEDPHLQPPGGPPPGAVTPPIAGTGPGATAEAAPPEAPPEAPAPETPQEA